MPPAAPMLEMAAAARKSDDADARAKTGGVVAMGEPVDNASGLRLVESDEGLDVSLGATDPAGAAEAEDLEAFDERFGEPLFPWAPLGSTEMPLMSAEEDDSFAEPTQPATQPELQPEVPLAAELEATPEMNTPEPTGPQVMLPAEDGEEAVAATPASELPATAAPEPSRDPIEEPALAVPLVPLTLSQQRELYAAMRQDVRDGDLPLAWQRFLDARERVERLGGDAGAKQHDDLMLLSRYLDAMLHRSKNMQR